MKIPVWLNVSWVRWGLAVVLSGGFHLSVLAIKSSPQKPPKRFRKVKFRILKRKRPRPRPPERRIEPRREVPKRRVKPRPRPRPRPRKRKRRLRRRPPPPRQKRPPPPPPNRTPRRPPPRNAPPPRPIFGVTMDSFAKGRGAKVAVRAGNTLMKDPDGIYKKPGQVRSYAAPRRVVEPRRPVPRRRGGTGKGPAKFSPIPVYEVDENPREVSKVRARYPAAAKREGLSAKVILSVEIRKTGRVRRVRVVSVRPSSAKAYGFGKAAARALKRFRFRPARYKGKPVDVVIRYIYRFELED